MYFGFKQKLEDFKVEELLESPPSGSGDARYLLIEKSGINTMDIIKQLTNNLPLKREDIGIAGLKDKDGITKQRLTLYKKRIQRCGGEDQILSILSQKCTILKTLRGEEPLMVGKNLGNHFEIRLRKRSPLPENLKLQLEANLEVSKTKGFPNAFGIQRFGKGNKNYKKTKKIFEAGGQHPEHYEVKFKLQSFGSMRFNEYVMQRRDQNQLLLNGDIMVNSYHGFGAEVAVYHEEKLRHFDYRKVKENNPKSDFLSPDYFSFESDYQAARWKASGPVLGYQQLLAPDTSPARLLDDQLITNSKFTAGGLTISKRYHLYGFRRILWAIPQHLNRSRDAGDLLLSFSLPTGVYASVFLACILKDIDPLGCISNNLIIPRIERTA